MMNKAWAFRKRAALDPFQDFALVSHGFLFSHLLPFSGYLLHPRGGASAPPPGRGKVASCLTTFLPVPVILLRTLCWCGSHTYQDLVSDMQPSDTGQAWEDRLRRLRHPAGEGCCTTLLPAGIGVLAALKLGFACRVTSHRSQLLTSLGLISWRRGQLRTIRTRVKWLQRYPQPPWKGSFQ